MHVASDMRHGQRGVRGLSALVGVNDGGGCCEGIAVIHHGVADHAAQSDPVESIRPSDRSARGDPED